MVGFFEVEGPREATVATETMQIGIDVATGRIVQPVHVVVFSEDRRTGAVIDLFTQDHMIKTVAFTLGKLVEFADELRLISRFAEQTRHGVFWVKFDAVLIADHPVRRAVLAGKEGATGRDATRSGRVGSRKIRALIR